MPLTVYVRLIFLIQSLLSCPSYLLFICEVFIIVPKDCHEVFILFDMKTFLKISKIILNKIQENVFYLIMFLLAKSEDLINLRSVKSSIIYFDPNKYITFNYDTLTRYIECKDLKSSTLTEILSVELTSVVKRRLFSS